MIKLKAIQLLTACLFLMEFVNRKWFAKSLKSQVHKQNLSKSMTLPKLTGGQKEHRTHNTRFAKSGDNCFDLIPIAIGIVKFEVIAWFENYG